MDPDRSVSRVHEILTFELSLIYELNDFEN